MVLDRAHAAGLARKAAQGDTAAFRGLIEATQGVVYRVALRVVRDAADAEDVVQETYVKAWQSLARMRDPEAVVGWICAIARHVATDRVRAKRSRPQAFSDADAARIAVERLTSDAPGADTLVASRQTREVVQRALDELDEKYRLALVLKDVDGLSAAEVSEALGIPIGTVESRATRAREKLAAKLKRLVAGGKL
jgi:RNA polymerase sigma-70 factor (ECF subfamily)